MLIVHRSERADYLVEALGDLLLDGLDDPMVTEVISVPTRGIERWLTQRLSHRLGATGASDGVCANVDFPFPGSLIGSATALACGFDRESDPWLPERSVWPLLELVDELFDEPFLAPLAAHLRAGSPPGDAGPEGLRRFATVRHLADLYDRYSVHRPDMLRSWWSEDGAAAVGASTGASWQRQLWRHLRARIAVPSPAERLKTARLELTAHPDRLDLPPRISVFGVTRLPVSHLFILQALALHRDVHLFLLHPSGQLWQNIATEDARRGRSLRRSDDTTVSLVNNALLRSWGRDAREMQLVLSAGGVTDGDHRPVASPAPGDGVTLLERLQSDIRADRPSPGPPQPGTVTDDRPLLEDRDDSVRVHSCHGRLRQVEVMRDAVLHLLRADPTLEPRDVIVMCPDIESFAPLIYAVFGSGSRVPGEPEGQGGALEPGPPQVRVRLADRSIRQTNPILGVTAQLLELASGRVPASEVLDLAGREPVSRRFRFDKEELSQLERWVAASGIRWGLDASHRQRWKLDHVSENTWRSGLDRLLLGVAVAEEDESLFGIVPLGDVTGGTVDLVGRFAELVERVGTALDSLRGRQTVSAWCEALADATESLAASAPDEEWQHDQMRRVLGDASAAAEHAGHSPLLDLAEIRSLLADRLKGRPTRANFRTGDLTICTLVPMRSVPHRVVGLLGLDDGAFPRSSAHDGDDLLLADPHVGDRDTRAEDRQLLLDALLAATDHLVVTYEGRDPRTNQERSPCVPIAELLDVIDRTVRLGESPEEPARRRIVVEHPLQSFDERNFLSDVLVPDVPWGFDPVELEGARSSSTEPAEAPPFLERPLAPLELPAVQLEALIRFLEHPVRAFLRDRLGWYGSGGAEEVKDALPVELDPLERWNLGDRMLTARLAGAGTAEAEAIEKGRGLIPPGVLGDRALEQIGASVEGLVAAVGPLISRLEGPDSIEVNVRLPDGRLLVGTVPDTYLDEGGRILLMRCVFSMLAAKHRLAAWARFLALTAARPDAEVEAITVGRGEGKSQGLPRIARAALPPLGPSAEERESTALALLAELVDLYDRGMCEPLPLFTKTSEKFADQLRLDDDAEAAARKVWESNPDNHGEDQEPEHRLVLGSDARFEHLLRARPREDERGPGWEGHPSRCGRLALRLWSPLLSHESRSFLP